MLAAGTCNEASCDCVEWFHQAALMYVGATPGWYGKEMPRTQTAMKDMLSTEFKTMMDEGKIITEKEQVKLSANPLGSLHTKRLVPNCKCVTATVCKIPDDSFGLPRWTVLTDQGPVIQGLFLHAPRDPFCICSCLSGSNLCDVCVHICVCLYLCFRLRIWIWIWFRIWFRI